MTGRIVARAERPHGCSPVPLNSAAMYGKVAANDVWQCDECQRLWVVRDSGSSNYEPLRRWTPLRWWHRRAHRALAQQRHAVVDVTLPDGTVERWCEHPPPPPGDFDCCASGRCEVCTPGFDWGRDR